MAKDHINLFINRYCDICKPSLRVLPIFLALSNDGVVSF